MKIRFCQWFNDLYSSTVECVRTDGKKFSKNKLTGFNAPKHNFQIKGPVNAILPMEYIWNASKIIYNYFTGAFDLHLPLPGLHLLGLYGNAEPI